MRAMLLLSLLLGLASGCSSGGSGVAAVPESQVDAEGNFVVPAELQSEYDNMIENGPPDFSVEDIPTNTLRAYMYYGVNTFAPLSYFESIGFQLKPGPQGEHDDQIQAFAERLGATVDLYWWDEFGTSVDFKLPYAVNAQHALQYYELIFQEFGASVDYVDSMVPDTDLNLPG